MWRIDWSQERDARRPGKEPLPVLVSYGRSGRRAKKKDGEKRKKELFK